MPFDPYGNYYNGARTLGNNGQPYPVSGRYFGLPTTSTAPGVTPVMPGDDPGGFGKPIAGAPNMPTTVDPWVQPTYSTPQQTIPYGPGASTPPPAASSTGGSYYDPGQLDWLAAINGQTPDQFLASQQQIQLTGSPPPTPFQSWSAQQQNIPQVIFNNQQQGQAGINQWTAQVDAANTGQGWIYEQLGNNSQKGYDAAGWMAAQNAPLINQLQGSLAENNGLQSQGLADLRTAASNHAAWDTTNLGNFTNAVNAPMQMFASPYVGDAQSNPEDVARQMQVYGQLQGAANGSLDQVSQAAQAYANAQDVANQQRSAATLEAAGNGALDINPTTMPGMQDLLAASKGSKDVHVGQEDPAAYAAMVDARNQLSALTKPEVTAQEKLAYEIAKQQQEQDESATRAALNTDAQRRGVSGIGTEIARSALGAQQTSRNRMLQDMDANSIAVQRAMSALNNYGNLSATMSGQANQIAMQNQATQLSALNNYTGISGSVLTANMNRRLQAEQDAYDAYATLRAQGFSEEYARGVAADNMANANADRRLGAMNSSATLATNMRNAGDAMNMFNQSQRQQQSQFADTFHANREDAAYGRQRDLFSATNTIGNNRMSDANDVFNGVTTTANNNFGRTMSTVNGVSALNGQTLGAQQWAIGNEGGNLGRQSGVIQTQLGNNTQRLGTNLSWGTQKTNDAIQVRNIDKAAQTDRDAVNVDNEIYPISGSYPGGSYNGNGIVSNKPYYQNDDPQDPNSPNYYGRYGTPP